MLIKLKANIPEIIVGVLLTVAVFATGVVFESSRHPPSKQQPSQESNESSRPIAPEHSADKTTDWLLVVFNGLLFGSTVLLWIANNRSAKVAERALTELEAPFIYIKIKSEDLIYRNGRADGKIRFLFGNYGHTPAHIVEFFDRIVPIRLPVQDGQPEPINPDTQRGTAMPYGVVAPPEDVSQDFSALVSELTSGKALFFIGYVRYADIFKRFYTVGFNFVFDPTRRTWVLMGGPDYNYHRQDKGPDPLPEWFSPSAKTGNLTPVDIQSAIQAFDKGDDAK
jgi:hypothetical protein